MVRYGRRDPQGKTPTRLLPPCSNTAQKVAGVQSTEPSETAAVYLLVSRAVNIEVVGCTDWFATGRRNSWLSGRVTFLCWNILWQGNSWLPTSRRELPMFGQMVHHGSRRYGFIGTGENWSLALYRMRRRSKPCSGIREWRLPLMTTIFPTR